MTGMQTDRFAGHFQKNKCGNQYGGFTLLELLIEIVVIAIVTVGLLERLMYYQEYAEKTVMEATVRNMRTGLQLRVANLMMQDKMGEVGNLLNENPITWLEAPPMNYLGELKAPQKNILQRGNWYFDLATRELTYLPDHRRFFDSGLAKDEAVRYRTSAMKYVRGKNSNEVLKLEGIALNVVNQYRWELAVQ